MKNSTIKGLVIVPVAMASSVCCPDTSATEATKEKAQGKAPNFLYIMTDQQSYYMISAISRVLQNDNYANIPYLHTPNLDRLVRSGYTFSNSYAAHPVSGPSRFALLTASSPTYYGMSGNYTPGGERGEMMYDMIQERSMGVLFKKAGYNTYYGGKCHLPWANGTKGKGSILEPPYKYGFDEYITKYDRGELAVKGAKFFSEYKSDKPFLLFLSFMNPHDICMSKLLFEDKQMSDFADVGDIESWSRENQLHWRDIYQSLPQADFKTDKYAKIPFNAAETERFPDVKIKRPYADSEEKTRAHLWFYYRLMEQVDAEIGMVLDGLENSQYKDNTIIVFTSDHGEMAGAHGAVGKNLPYRECQRVPMIFVGKGISEGVVDTESLVCNGWDLLPTMLDLAGLEIPEELHGLSLKNTIENGEKPEREYLYFETVNSFGIVEGCRYKYVHFGRIADESGNGTEVLFDLEKDPGELRNLVFDPAYNQKLNELRKELDRQMKVYDTSFDMLKEK